jgi:UDP:flavonoid glycosyltransferase YjiC (YdhE family)
MRVLFTSWATPGHFAPLVPIGWALRAAGHEVLVASHPADTEPIVAAGLPALPVGPDVNMFAVLRAKRHAPQRQVSPLTGSGSGQTRDYRGIVEAAEAVADVLADDLVAFCRTWRPDLVIYEPAALAGPLVARVLGIPAARALWTCDFTAPALGFPAAISGALPARFGLDALDTAGDLTLDPCPPRLQIVDDLARQPIRYVPYNGPARLPDWLHEPAPRRRVCVTWGTSLHAIGAVRMQHVPRVVRSLGALDAEIVIAVLDAHRDLFGELPSNVRAVGPVPLHLLLPTCDAIVHQGGGGTLMTAMSCGVPQVVVPSIADQIFNASHVATSGAGIHVPGREDVNEEDVVAATDMVLSQPAYRSAARILQGENLARPTPAEVVPVLERLALPVSSQPEHAGLAVSR